MNKMRNGFTIGALISAVMFSATLCIASTIPSSVLPALAEQISGDFTSVNEIRTYEMSDDLHGRFDIVVAGIARPSGWRVEVWSVGNGLFSKRWDSRDTEKGVEFAVLGQVKFNSRPKEYDYDIVIEGCVAEVCTDGISGFLFLSGKTGKTYEAKIVTHGTDREHSYKVTFSEGIPDDAKKILVEAICSSNSVSSKHGLPFECKGS